MMRVRMLAKTPLKRVGYSIRIPWSVNRLPRGDQSGVGVPVETGQFTGGP
jgi:hypothetical protein